MKKIFNCIKVKGTFNELEHRDYGFTVSIASLTCIFLKINVLHLFRAAAGQENSVSCISHNEGRVLNVAKESFSIDLGNTKNLDKN